MPIFPYGRTYDNPIVMSRKFVNQMRYGRDAEVVFNTAAEVLGEPSNTTNKSFKDGSSIKRVTYLRGNRKVIIHHLDGYYMQRSGCKQSLIITGHDQELKKYRGNLAWTIALDTNQRINFLFDIVKDYLEGKDEEKETSFFDRVRNYKLGEEIDTVTPILFEQRDEVDAGEDGSFCIRSHVPNEVSVSGVYFYQPVEQLIVKDKTSDRPLIVFVMTNRWDTNKIAYDPATEDFYAVKSVSKGDGKTCLEFCSLTNSFAMQTYDFLNKTMKLYLEHIGL